MPLELGKARTLHEPRLASDAIFGARYRLEVLAAIARSDGEFYVRDLRVGLGLRADNLITPTVNRLVDAGWLKQLPKRDGKQWYAIERPESALWRLAVELHDELSGAVE